MFASDAPGFAFHTNKLKKDVNPIIDKNGLQVLEYMHRTNNVENWHT